MRVEVVCNFAEMITAELPRRREVRRSPDPEPLQSPVRIAPGISLAAHSAAVNSSLKCTDCEDTSDQFQVISTNLNRQGALDRVNGNHELPFVALQKNSL